MTGTFPSVPERAYTRSSVLLVLIAFILPTLSWLGGDAHKDLVKTAAVAGTAMLGLYCLMLRPLLPTNSPRIIAATLPLLAVYIVASFYPELGEATAGIKTCIQLIVVIVWVSTLSNTEWSYRHFSLLSILTTGLIAIHLAGWLVLPHYSDAYAGFTDHKNALGALCLINFFITIAAYVSAPPTINRAPFLIMLLVPVITTIVAHSRGPLIAIATSLLVVVIFRIMSPNRMRWTVALLLPLMLYFTYLYTTLEQYYWFYTLQSTIYDYTGQNIYSGRNLIWPLMFEAIFEHPYLGWGAGAKPNDYLLGASLDVTWSAHNLYLTILFQTGIAGFLAFSYMLNRYWYLLRNNPTDKVSTVSAAFFVGLIVHQMFEVMLTQNNLDSGLSLWLIPAVGIGRSVMQKNPKSE